MAKSIRSKRMRKLRAFKRIRYGEKELARLKNMLAKAAQDEQSNQIEGDSSGNDGLTPMDADSTFDNTSEPTKPSKYPCWLSHFKIKKLAKQERKRKRKEMKRLKKENKILKKNKSRKSK